MAEDRDDPDEQGDTADGVLFDRSAGWPDGDRVLAIACGGLNNRPGMPQWEFAAILARMGVRAVFVRDLAQCWYQAGVAGHGGSYRAAVEGVAGFVRELEPTRAFVVGSSAGGFFGASMMRELGVPGLLLAPQANIGPLWRLRHRDDRWRRRMVQAYRHGLARGPRGPVWDVGGELPGAEVHVAVDHRLDQVHAARFRDAEVVVHPGGGHRVAVAMRDQGLLDEALGRMLERAVSPATSPSRR